MEAFGAELRMVPSDDGKVTPALFERFKKEIAVLASEPNTFWTDQFHNEDAVLGYMGIGHELLQQTGGRIDAFLWLGRHRRDVARRVAGVAGVRQSRTNHRTRTRLVARADRRPGRPSPGRGNRHRERAAAPGRSAVRRGT